MISNCGKDENGRYTGGYAGDQTGREWQIIPWYNRPWNCVIRHPDAKVRKLIAAMAKAAANNDCIGYDQWQRLTFWELLKKGNYRVRNIKTKCEADCSSGVMSIIKAVGYRKNIPALQRIEITTTHYMRKMLKDAGFQILTDSKYLVNDAYLLPGDILLNDGAHVATNLTTGSLVKKDKTSMKLPKTKKYGAKLPTLVEKKALKKGSKGEQVELLQKFLNWLGANLEVDGDFGDDTEAAVREFQKLVRIEVDGKFGPDSLQKAKKFKK